MILEADKNIVGVIVDSVTEVKNPNATQIEGPRMRYPRRSARNTQARGKPEGRLLILVDLKQVNRRHRADLPKRYCIIIFLKRAFSLCHAAYDLAFSSPCFAISSRDMPILWTLASIMSSRTMRWNS
jgi:hypothetical protein